MRPCIVHISADYPDTWRPDKTRAIAALVEGTSDRFTHRVYSLNRSGQLPRALVSPGAVVNVADDGTLASWRYLAPGGGLWLARSMSRVGEAVARDIRNKSLSPALVIGHKLSFEGIAARETARLLGVPYALSLQGNTDQKLLSARRDLATLYRSVWNEAALIFPFAPWIASWCTNRLGATSAEVLELPCVPVADTVIPPQASPPRVVTAFNHNDWKNKNVGGLAQACAMLRSEFSNLTLEIAGSGNASSESSVERAIERAGARGFTRRIGRLPADAIQPWMNEAAVFAMPSRRESFGMVFIEALLAGCPIVYPRGAAIDGYLDKVEFARAVDARNKESIMDGLRAILRDNSACKTALADWQQRKAEQFRRETVLSAFTDAVNRTIT